MDVASWYRSNYRKILVLPVVLLFVFVYLAFFNPGIRLGMDFVGGTMISFDTNAPVDAEHVASVLKEALGVKDITVVPVTAEGKYGAMVEITGDVNADSAVDALKKAVPDASGIVVRSVAPSLGEDFWNAAKNIAIWAFILLTISVFVFFRQVVPATIMVLSAIYDVIGMLALMALFDIPLTLETITVLLLMVGYSIDTDVVLSTFILKREEGDVFERAARAATTGIHMTGTTLVAMLFVFAVGMLTRNLTVMRIGNVMVFGLLCDIIVTWFLNASLLIQWVRRNASRR